MSQLKPPNPAKLIIGAFMQDKTLFEPIARRLADHCGPIDMVSHWFPFDYTQYYTREMGSGLSRRMLSFEKLIGQDELSDIKLFTNNLEAEYTTGKTRRVNIDPGFLLPERLVLATGKNFAHRIYIGKQIYADLTLIYQKGGYRALAWTYPDYTSPDMLTFLERARKKYMHRT